MSNWTDRIVGDRMAVDRDFSERVAASEFSSQEWGMIMTAVEFEIESPETPADATLVANTDQLDQIMPAVDDVGSQVGPMGAAPGGDNGRTNSRGIVGTIKAALGFGGADTDSQRIEAAEALTDEYAERLQAHLEDNGKWTMACEAAARNVSTSARTDSADESGTPSEEMPDNVPSATDDPSPPTEHADGESVEDEPDQ